jgi:photosystem II stability/assembly factor-like uncharacterized protein
MKTSSTSTIKHRRALRGSLFAPILLLALLLAACGASTTTDSGNAGTPTATTAATGTTPTATAAGGSTATPVVQGTPAAKIAFKEIRMITTTEGWALTNSEVLKTSDGGAHWINAGPLATQLKNPVADFMNMQNAWVAATIPNGANPNAIQVIRTQNGGQNWQSWSTSILTTDSASMVGDAPHFVNTQNGWIEIVTNGGPAAGSESVEIFATTNGGQNWSLVANTLSGNSGLPNGGLKTGISFKDALNGWATGGDYSYYPWLYVTHDGGHTWQKQGLPPNTAIFDMTTPPVFFGNSGIMPVTVINNGNGNNTMIYVTNNSGQTWTQASTSPATFQAQTVYSVDMQHVWAVDGNGLLYATSDGGHTWQKLLTNSLHMTQLSFVDDSNGWALSSVNNGPATLLHTTDGGHSWHRV